MGICKEGMGVVDHSNCLPNHPFKARWHSGGGSAPPFDLGLSPFYTLLRQNLQRSFINSLTTKFVYTEIWSQN